MNVILVDANVVIGYIHPGGRSHGGSQGSGRVRPRPGLGSVFFRCFGKERRKEVKWQRGD